MLAFRRNVAPAAKRMMSTSTALRADAPGVLNDRKKSQEDKYIYEQEQEQLRKLNEKKRQQAEEMAKTDAEIKEMEQKSKK